MDISVYTFEDADGNEAGSYKTQDFKEADAYAKKYHYRIIENIYEWTEAYPVDGFDYTER